MYGHLCPVKVYAAHFCKLVCTLGFPDLLTSSKNQELNVGSGSRFWPCVTKDCATNGGVDFEVNMDFLALSIHVHTDVSQSKSALLVSCGRVRAKHAQKMNLFKNGAVMLGQEKRVARYPTHKLR